MLDPAHSNQLKIDGLAPLAVSLVADTTVPYIWQNPKLTWSAPGAQSCTATGGVTGDGWAGSRPASGTATLTGTIAGRFNYTITCTGLSVKGAATIEVIWVDYAPSVILSATNQPITIGGPAYFYIDTNIVPCTLSGGTPGDGWTGTVAGSGQVIVVPTQTGNIDYAATCAIGTHVASAHAIVPIVPVSVTMRADATRVRMGSTVTLYWQGGGTGGECAGVGGSSTDQWAQQVGLPITSSNTVTESAAGTYTYGLHCTSGGQSGDGSITVEFTSDPPLLTLTALSPTQTVYPRPPAQPTPDLQWSSNVAPCNLLVLGPLKNSGVGLEGQYPAGTASDAQTVAGVYNYELQCGGQIASTTITWTTPNPTVTMSTATTTWAANQSYAINWSSNTAPCKKTGGATGDGWASNFPSGQPTYYASEAAPGTYTYTISCGVGTSSATAQVTATVPAPSVTISASPAIVTQYPGTDVSWHSTVAPCKIFDSSSTSGTDVLPDGTMNFWERTTGSTTYTVKCGTGDQVIQASTNVTVNASNVATTVASSLTSAVINTPVTLSWTSSGESICTALGSNGNDEWTGSKASVGSQIVTSPDVGTVTYGLNCGATSSQTTVNYTAPGTTVDPGTTPSVTLTADKSAQTIGSQITLTWNSQNSDSCTATGGANADGWTGSLSLSGTMQITESSAAAITYGITCTGAPPAATAQVTVAFSSSTSSGASSKGGGGAMDTLSLLVMSLSLGVGAIRRRALGRASGSSLRGLCIFAPNRTGRG